MLGHSAEGEVGYGGEKVVHSARHSGEKGKPMNLGEPKLPQTRGQS